MGAWVLTISDNAGADTGEVIIWGLDIEPEASVPEPATMLLLGAGLVGLAGFSRRKFRK